MRNENSSHIDLRCCGLCGGRKPNRFGYSKYEQFTISCACYSVGALIVYVFVINIFLIFCSLCCLIGIGASAFGTFGAQRFIATLHYSTDKLIDDANEVTGAVKKTIGAVDDTVGNVKKVSGKQIILFVNHVIRIWKCNHKKCKYLIQYYKRKFKKISTPPIIN